MRAPLVALLLVLTSAAGCVAPGLSRTDVPLEIVEIPEGAIVETIPDGVRLVFGAVALPFLQNVTIPPGTTIVRATGITAEDLPVSITLRHAETLRRRCNLAPVDAWRTPVLGRASCSGVTLVDALPDQWQVRANGPAETVRVEIDLLTTPLDGVLAQLDVSQLSMREHALKPTQSQMVESFDGTPLYVEVTIPEGPGPWPTVLWSSPYDYEDRVAGEPSAWSYFANDWAQRGYAVVAADVRGYGESEGCVDVWGPNEQRDQAFLVDWVAAQPWSDGNVGFYGQSYVATTPLEAAIQSPAALKAIIAVAPVSDAYNDWHFGGVPNGENAMSPIAYQTLGGGLPFPDTSARPDPAGLPYTLARVDNGFCDPTVLARPNDPRAVYDAFYEERNFSARAGDITAAVLYTQGFEDSNVKSALIPDLFNAIQAPKLGLFGHWVHQHPTRADNEALFLLWLDEHVKGKPVGFANVAPVHVTTNDGRERAADAWPPLDATPFTLHLDVQGGALATDPGDGFTTIVMDSAAGSTPISFASLPFAQTLLGLESAPLAAPVHLSGQGQVHIEATLQHAQNAYVAAYLYEVGDKDRLVTWGMFNLAHRNGHDRYEPVAPQERVQVGIPLLPTEWVFAEGAKLRLEIRGARVSDWSLVPATEPGALDVYAAGSALELPTVAGGAVALPATAQR